MLKSETLRKVERVLVMMLVANLLLLQILSKCSHNLQGQFPAVQPLILRKNLTKRGKFLTAFIDSAQMFGPEIGPFYSDWRIPTLYLPIGILHLFFL